MSVTAEMLFEMPKIIDERREVEDDAREEVCDLAIELVSGADDAATELPDEIRALVGYVKDVLFRERVHMVVSALAYSRVVDLMHDYCIGGEGA